MASYKKWLKNKEDKVTETMALCSTEATNLTYEIENVVANPLSFDIVPKPPTPARDMKQEKVDTTIDQFNVTNNYNHTNPVKVHYNLENDGQEQFPDVVDNLRCNLCKSDVGTNTYHFNLSENLKNGNQNQEMEIQSNSLTSIGNKQSTISASITIESATASVTKLEFVCSLYVTACPTIIRPGDVKRDPVCYKDLENAIQLIKPIGSFKVSETKCGLIATFTHELDADSLLLNLNLAQALHGPVQVARFSRRDARYKQIATLRDVPWSIPMQDICTALTFQGISYENVDRFRNNVRVEILDANHYENLISQGLNFFDAARFSAVPERWYRNSGSNSSTNDGHVDTDSVLQCYRCQGFWHVAANCRHLPRCVRCGEPHGVEFCPRPRNNPICCHCSGAHHAAYKNCPVRVQLMNAIPVSMSLSTTRSISQSREMRSRCRS